VVLRKTARREQLAELIAGLPPCLIGMEACGGAHEWGRKFQAYGYRVGIMMGRFATPYRKSSRNDGNDGEAYGHQSKTKCGRKKRAASAALVRSEHKPPLVILVGCKCRTRIL
jgi:hypothetical protein